MRQQIHRALTSRAAALLLLATVLCAAAGTTDAPQTRPGDASMDEVPAPRVLRIDDRNYACLDAGEGPAVVLLHGSWIAEGQWDDQVRALARAGYRVICPFRAGMGGSDLPRTFTMDADVRDVIALLDALGVGRFVVVGHSHGSGVAREILLAHPDRVCGVVSVDGCFGNLKGAVMKAADERLSPAGRALLATHGATLERVGRLGTHDYPSAWNVRKLLAWHAWHEANGALKERLREEDRVKPTSQAQAAAGRYYQAPLLAIAAGFGRLRPDDPESRALAERLPAEDATLVVITESGHWVQQEQPERTNAALLDFLRRLP